MNSDEDKLHVIRETEEWDVENQDGDILTQEKDREKAVEVARAMAQETGVGTIILHDGDGVTEEIPVSRQPVTDEETPAELDNPANPAGFV